MPEGLREGNSKVEEDEREQNRQQMVFSCRFSHGRLLSTP